jgi:hypothetical protein
MAMETVISAGFVMHPKSSTGGFVIGSGLVELMKIPPRDRGFMTAAAPLGCPTKGSSTAAASTLFILSIRIDL